MGEQKLEAESLGIINNFDEELVRACYRFLDHKTETEVRLLDTKNGDMKSFFVHSEEEFVYLCKENNGLKNVYVGINERIKNGKGAEHVISIKTVVIDIDAVRAKDFAKQPATEEELNPVEKVADRIINDLKKINRPQPVKLRTGNGYQLWFAIPVIDINDINRIKIGKKLHSFQTKIIEKYSEDTAKIDSIGDLPRIIKVWGTLNIKGQETEGRIYRVAQTVGDYKRLEDPILKEEILGLEEESFTYTIQQITELNEDHLPPCIKKILKNYVNEDGKYWMRLIEMLSSFFCTAGLEESKALQIIKNWNMKQPYHEPKENDELKNIIKRIYKNKIIIPSCEGIQKNKSGFPTIGVAELNLCNPDPLCNGCKNPVIRYDRAAQGGKNSDVLFNDLKEEVLNAMHDRKPWLASEPLAKKFQELFKTYTIRQDNVDAEIYTYENGVYRQNGKSHVEEFCRKILGKYYSGQIKNTVLQKVIVDTYVDPEEFFMIREEYKIAVENGILNLKTLELEPFNCKYIFFNKLNAKYIQGVQCPNILQFLKDILKPEDIIIIQELIGYILVKNYRIPKAFMFTGSGRNGKGVLTELIKRFIGLENTCSIPLEQLDPKKDKFALAEFLNKMANIASEISSEALNNSAAFKTLTGGDQIHADRKFKNRIKFVNFAKLIYCANQMPVTRDISIAFWGRWIIIEFLQTFYTEKEIIEMQIKGEDITNIRIADRYLIDKLITQEELSGLLNWALEGLQRLLQQGNFTYSKTTIEIEDIWIKKSDSFSSFIKENIEEDDNAWINKLDLRMTYMQYCKDYKLKLMNEKHVKKILNEKAIDEQRITDENGKLVRSWVGIKWK